jgi:hypothetical protein
MLTLGAGIAFGQEDGEQSYTGTWSLVIGPSRLVWELDADTYQFYAYQAGTVRIGSRGDIIIEDDRITFIARETTEDGEQWTEVDLPEEQAQTSFAYSVTEVRIFSKKDEAMGGDAEMAADEADAVVEQQLVLRLAIPGRPQFFTDYREGSGEELTGETDDAAGDDAGEPNGTNDGEG